MPATPVGTTPSDMTPAQTERHASNKSSEPDTLPRATLGCAPSLMPPEWYAVICKATASDKAFAPVVATLTTAPTDGAIRILLPFYALGDDGSLWHKGANEMSRLCVPNGPIRRDLVKFCHEVGLSRQGYSDIGPKFLLAEHRGLRNGPDATLFHVRRHKATASQVRSPSGGGLL